MRLAIYLHNKITTTKKKEKSMAQLEGNILGVKAKCLTTYKETLTNRYTSKPFGNAVKSVP